MFTPFSVVEANVLAPRGLLQQVVFSLKKLPFSADLKRTEKRSFGVY
jgi:hypothetical protein